MTAPHIFTCSICLNDFTADPSFGEDQRRAEYEAAHGKPFPDDGEGVSPCCDDCYKTVMAWADENGYLA